MISDFSRSFFLFVVRWIILVGLYLFNTCTVGNLEVFTVVEMSWPWTRNFLHNWYVFNCKSFRASWDATSSSTPGARLQKKCWQINKIKPGKSFSSAGRAGSQTELCLLWILSAHSTNHLSKLLFLTKLQMETSSNFSLSRRRGSRSRVWQQGEGKRESFPGRCKVWAPSWRCEVTSSARGSRRNLL